MRDDNIARRGFSEYSNKLPSLKFSFLGIGIKAAFYFHHIY